MIARARIVVCRSATPRARARDERSSELGFAALLREFPTVDVDVEIEGEADAAYPFSTIDLRSWQDLSCDFAPFDRHVEELAARGPATIVVRGEADEAVRGAHEMLTRWQRFIGRRNVFSSDARFEAVLAGHRAVYESSDPRVRADYERSLDTWQWLLRLVPEASAAAQIAALFHDVERLVAGGDGPADPAPISNLGPRSACTRRRGRMTRVVLVRIGVDEVTRARACALVGDDDPADGDPEKALLGDATGLSFFSLASSAYADAFGPDAARRAITSALVRMRPRARARLAGVRLRVDVARMLCEELDRTARANASGRRVRVDA